MNTFATVIVTNTKKLAAQDVLNALYSTPSTEDTDAVVSTAGDEFFGVELEKGVSKYWASSGAFLSDELTALINRKKQPRFTTVRNQLSSLHLEY